MSEIFRINFRKFALLLTPTFLRRPALTGILHALVAPIDALSDVRQTRRLDTLQNLSYNGQVCRLKTMLNRRFDIDDYDNGFLIDDIVTAGEYIIAYDENHDFDGLQIIIQDSPLCTLVWDTENIERQTDSFVVFVPTEVFHDKQQLSIAQSLVEQFRLVSRFPKYEPKT